MKLRYALIVISVFQAVVSAWGVSVSPSPAVAPPSSKISIVGAGFSAGERVILTFDSQAIATVPADGSGGFTVSFTVPKVTQPGAHTLQAAGQTSGLTASAAFTVRTNWPSFKNVSARTGTNALENTINKSNATSLSQSWVGIMGDLVDFSSPAVVDGVVYIGSFDGKLYAFKADGCGSSSCQPLWSGKTGNDITSSPAVANGVVYIGSADHKLYAFAAKGCGKSACSPLWTGALGGSIIESSPLVVNGVVYVGSYDHNLYAFPAAGCGTSSCAPLWTAATGEHVTSSPAFANGVVYLGSEDGLLYAFSAGGCKAATCSPLWTGTAGTTLLGSSPAVANGVVYIGSFDGNLVAFDAAGCGQSTCQPLWEGPTNGIIEGSPSVANGVVYIGSDDLIFAFPAGGCGSSTCSPLWSGEAVGAQAGIVSAPTIANGLLYVSENNGMVMVFNAGGCGKSFCLPLTQLFTENEQIVSSSPTVVNGTVYFGSADEAAPPIGRLYVYKLAQ